MDRFWPERVTLFIAIAIVALLLLIDSGAPEAGTDAWIGAISP